MLPGKRNSQFGRKEQHESQISPAVADGFQMRPAPAFIGPEDDGNFRHARAGLGRFDHKLRAPFHAAGAHVDAIVNLARESAQAAEAIADAGLEEQIHHRGQPGIADVFVAPRHRARLDAATEAIAHHDVVAFAPFGHELRDGREIVTIVGVTHDDEAPARRGDARAQGVAITARAHANHSRAALFGDFERAVGRAVVGNDDFAANPRSLERFTRLIDAKAE